MRILEKINQRAEVDRVRIEPNTQTPVIECRVLSKSRMLQNLIQRAELRKIRLIGRVHNDLLPAVQGYQRDYMSFSFGFTFKVQPLRPNSHRARQIDESTSGIATMTFARPERVCGRVAQVGTTFQ